MHSKNDSNQIPKTDGPHTVSNPELKGGRRRFLAITTGVVGLIGAAIASWPFLASFKPSARAKAVGSPIKVDLRHLKPGEQVTVVWQGQPQWVLRRDNDMLERLSGTPLTEQLRDPDSDVASQQPTYARNETRSIKSEYLVVTAVCTHLGCVPLFRPEIAPADLGDKWLGGYLCPCHKSKFDFAGRVFKAVPAPTNLVIPPHRYIDDDTVLIGVDDGL